MTASRILDFGLARLEGQESLTLSGDLMGTVLYMSPEQAMAKRIPLDHRTDVYSLGATMYEALSDEPPIRGKDQRDTLSQIIDRDPQSLRQLNRRVPVDLETIAPELQSFLRVASAGWAKVRVGVSPSLDGVPCSLESGRFERPYDVRRHAPRREETSITRSRNRVITPGSRLRRGMEPGWIAHRLRCRGRHRTGVGCRDQRRRSRVPRTLGEVWSVAWSPGGRLASAGQDGRVHVWDAARSQRGVRIDAQGPAAWSKDDSTIVVTQGPKAWSKVGGDIVVTDREEPGIRVLDSGTHDTRVAIHCEETIVSLDVSAVSPRIAAAVVKKDSTSSVRIFDMGTRR